MLDFRIYSFLAVCKYLSYTRAAQELNLTQPAITQHIQYLQKQYQVKLFTRENNALVLTKEGELFRNTMLALNQAELKLQDDLQNINAEKYIIHFGATRAFAEYELCDNLAAYLKEYPNRNVQLMVRDTPTLLRLLDEGVLHFAIVDDTFSKNQYKYIPWSTDPYICVCSGAHPLPDGELLLKDLLSWHLIAYADNFDSFDIVQRLLVSRNIMLSDFERFVAINDLQVIKQLLAADCGLAFLPRKTVAEELSQGILKEIPLSDCHLFREYNYIWRIDSIHEPLYRFMYQKLHDLDFSEWDEEQEYTFPLLI